MKRTNHEVSPFTYLIKALIVSTIESICLPISSLYSVSLFLISPTVPPRISDEFVVEEISVTFICVVVSARVVEISREVIFASVDNYDKKYPLSNLIVKLSDEFSPTT